MFAKVILGSVIQKHTNKQLKPKQSAIIFLEAGVKNDIET